MSRFCDCSLCGFVDGRESEASETVHRKAQYLTYLDSVHLITCIKIPYVHTMLGKARTVIAIVCLGRAHVRASNLKTGDNCVKKDNTSKGLPKNCK